jgi:hypothetical protein
MNLIIIPRYLYRLQIAGGLIYVFSGIQKMNPEFVPDTFEWMISAFDGILISPTNKPRD